eukprot:11911170-Heterocapsa_arctica.AAC.1
MLLHTVGHRFGGLPPEEWTLAAREPSSDREMHKGLSLIVRHGVNGNEPQALRAVHWITDNVASNGFRIPNAGERAAAFGMRSYLTDMTTAGWLTEKELVNATGN